MLRLRVVSNMSDLPMVELTPESANETTYYIGNDGVVFMASGSVVESKEFRRISQREYEDARTKREAEREFNRTKASQDHKDRETAAASEIEDSRRLHAETQKALEEMRKIMKELKKTSAAS